MAICKSCQLDLTRPKDKNSFKLPTNIPVSKEMESAIQAVRRDPNDRRSKSRGRIKR